MSKSEKELVITRVLDAPRDLVFKAWTEAERLAQWWGPRGFEMLSCKVDLRPGGIFHYGMSAPSGERHPGAKPPEPMWGRFVYREIRAPERLVFVVSFSDKDAGVTRHPMSATWPLEVLNTLTFTETGGKTTLTMRGVPINATEEERKTFEDSFDGMQKGFAGTLGQLDEYLATHAEKA